MQDLHCQCAVDYCVFCSECFEKYTRKTHLNLSTLKCRLTRQISVYTVLSKAKFDYKNAFACYVHQTHLKFNAQLHHK